MGKFVVSTRTNGEFQFNLKADNGQVILTSEGYSARAGCDNGIESVRKNAEDDGKYDRKEAKNGKFYFNLKAGNGQIIGSSQMYESEAGRDNGIDSVKRNAPDASVVDETGA
ncbi:YegP family protein [Spirosoma daeguense]